MTDHPITPPPELRRQWREQAPLVNREEWLIERAAQWGADQELQACIDVLSGQWECDALSLCTGWKEFRDELEEILRTARRPKPPSLKEQAWKLLECYGTSGVKLTADQCNTIRLALEGLPDD